MNIQSAKTILQEILALADIKIDGTNPWDIHVHNDNVYPRILHYYTLGLGEAYMDGWWDCERVDEFCYRLLCALAHNKNAAHHKLFYNKAFLFAGLRWCSQYIKALLTNRQSRSNAMNIGKRHYDVGNDLFTCMLDKELNYTCGYWAQSDNLDDAQMAKLKLICDKLYLKPGQKVLDIGCGWGGFARYAAQHYGATVVGITVSRRQKELADKLCAGYPIEIRLQDYRTLQEKFDHICSIGMFEHVGNKNYREYMQVAGRCLNDGGLFLLHTIGEITRW